MSKTKSIYGKLKQVAFEPQAVPMLIHGDNGSEALHVLSERITNVRSKRTQLIASTLKLSAAANGLFSLSCNQINISSAIFTIHREIPYGMWFHKTEKEAASKAKEETIDEDEGEKLKAEDYEIYMNPKILAETEEQEYAWEFCGSFPNIRCMIRRPLGIKVSYLNQEGDEIESDLFDFNARVFLHELDHVNGKTMTHWRMSEGNIDIIQGQQDNYKNLMSTIDFYKHKIDSMKSEFGDVFADKRKHELVTDSQGKQWKKFPQEGREIRIEGMDTPSFEDAMLIDMIRSTRKDKLTQESSSSKQAAAKKPKK